MWKFYSPIFEYDELVANRFGWTGHIFFGYDLIENLRPKLVVELGTHYGCSLFSFAQAIKDSDLDTELYAIDCWKGDKHAGYYNNEVYDFVKDTARKYYSDQKLILIKKTFDEAISDIKDNSIDILHIDGLHTYEAVKHDFESWKTKLKNDSIVLFHDITVADADFGVWKIWKELKETQGKLHFYEFSHSNGLGLLFNGSLYLDILKEFEDLEIAKVYSLKSQQYIAQFNDRLLIKTLGDEIKSIRSRKFIRIYNLILKVLGKPRI